MATDQSKPAGPPSPGAVLRHAGLRHTQTDELSLSRRRCGRGFVYHDAAGRRVSDRLVIDRIRTLAVPPDYRNLRIAADPAAHLQAVGEDAAGRLQYRYHPEWETVRETEKVQRLALIARAIPRVRWRVAQDLRGDVGTREQALAAVVSLIDHTHIRIGGEDYVHSGRCRGACTLRRQSLFAQRRRRTVTAKVFRTLAATAAAGMMLARISPAKTQAARRRQLTGVMREVAELFGNTPAVARRSYVHKELVNAFLEGRLLGLYARTRGGGRRKGEALVAALFDATVP